MIMQDAVDAIHKAGFKVYLPKLDRGREPTWAYFTDGQRIGYIQRGDFGWGWRLSTVHVPNRVTGTGFSLQDTLDAINTEDLTREALERAFGNAPWGMSTREAESVTKWASWESFAAANRWIEYVEAEKEAGQ